MIQRAMLRTPTHSGIHGNREAWMFSFGSRTSGLPRDVSHEGAGRPKDIQMFELNLIALAKHPQP